MACTDQQGVWYTWPQLFQLQKYSEIIALSQDKDYTLSCRCMRICAVNSFCKCVSLQEHINPIKASLHQLCFHKSFKGLADLINIFTPLKVFKVCKPVTTGCSKRVGATVLLQQKLWSNLPPDQMLKLASKLLPQDSLAFTPR